METQEEAIDNCITQIRQFVRKDLLNNLSGEDGSLNPDREWSIIVQSAAKIRAVDHVLSKDRKILLEQAIDNLQDDLNKIIDILKRRLQGGGRSDTETVYVINDLKNAADRNFSNAMSEFYSLHRKSQNENSKITNNYTNFGQAGAVGPNTNLAGSSFSMSNVDLGDSKKLIEELGFLRSKLKEISSTIEHDESILAIGKAQAAVQSGQNSTAMGYLAKAGTWALDAATKMGVSIATAAITKALGLK